MGNNMIDPLVAVVVLAAFAIVGLAAGIVAADAILNRALWRAGRWKL